jgi:uncharacterized protein YktB (UPF0637 family)
MNFNGFHKSDFDVFKVDGLEARMTEIREKIQPKFRAISEVLLPELMIETEQEIFLHVAKHLRRKVNPPVDTWSAYCMNKRGYKAHPHFQVGLFDDRVFIWLAFMKDMPNKRNVMNVFLNCFDEFESAIPEEYVISFDHHKRDAKIIGEFTESELRSNLLQVRDNARLDLLVGKHLFAGTEQLENPAIFMQEVRETFMQLMPIYKMDFS